MTFFACFHSFWLKAYFVFCKFSCSCSLLVSSWTAVSLLWSYVCPRRWSRSLVSSITLRFCFCYPSIHSMPVVGEFGPLTFRIIINRQALTGALLLVVCGLFRSSTVPFFPWCCELMIFHSGILWLPSLYPLWIFGSFLLYSYHEAYIKQFINITFCFTLIKA